METKSKGIDLSTWNGDVDYKRVKEDGIDFVLLRTGFRKVTDTKFLEHVEGFKKVGIEIPGVYHYSYATNGAEVISEAKHCLELVEQAGLPKENTLIFFETDTDSILKALDRGITLHQSDIVTHAVTFCNYVKSKGYQFVGIKCNLDFYNQMYLPDMRDRFLFWLVDYSGSESALSNVLIRQYTNKGYVNGIRGQVNLDRFTSVDETFESDATAEDTIRLALSFLGANEKDGSYKEIIDIYNSYEGEFPRGTKMSYDWAWCACFWSALAVKLGITDIVPIEISCGYLVEEARKKGIWVEDDGYIPDPGDAILYDWDGVSSSASDCVGWPDHVGLVAYVDKEHNQFLVIEGNKNDEVGCRVVPFNYIYTRGFITPTYDHQPLPEDLTQTLKDLTSQLTGDAEVSSSSPQYIPKPVSYAESFSKNVAGSYMVTASSLNLRRCVGTSDSMVVCTIPNGGVVRCYGYFTDLHPDSSKERWLYVQYESGANVYTGFVCGKYVKKM